MQSVMDSPIVRDTSLKLQLTVQAGQWTDDELESAVHLLAGLLRARDAQRDYQGQFRLADKLKRSQEQHRQLISWLLGWDRAFSEFVYGDRASIPPLDELILGFSRDVEMAVRDAQ